MPADIVAGEEQVSGSGLEDKNLSADLETTLDEGRSSWVDSRGLRSLRQSDAHPAHTHGPCVCTSKIIPVSRVRTHGFAVTDVMQAWGEEPECCVICIG